MNEVDISEHELLQAMPAVLHALLKDHTRTAYENEKCELSGVAVDKEKQWNIIWGTKCYLDLCGAGFDEKDEITEEKITGKHRLLVRPRAVKERDVQRQRSKEMAEVFTPGWICNAQNNQVDDAWFGRTEVFNREFIDEAGVHRWVATEGPIVFDEEPSRTSKKSWQDYVKRVSLEITCGEAPYIVSRYDAVTGTPELNLNQRIGLLDRKLRIVSENTTTSTDWLKWAREAVKAVYGFEWQGDNLLLAREAILFSVNDYYLAKFKRELREESWTYFAYIISWNFWQMDGLKMVIPYSCDDIIETDLFGEHKLVCPACAQEERFGHIGIKCVIRDWKKTRHRQKIRFENAFSLGSC